LGKSKFNFNSSNGGHKTGVLSLATINKLLASGGEDGFVKIWDMTSGVLKYTLTHSSGLLYNYVISLASLDNNLLASGGFDGTIKIWNLNDQSLKYSIYGGHIKKVSKLVYLGNNLLASGSDDCSVKVWDTNTGTLKYNFDSTNGGHKFEISSLIKLNSNLIASAAGVSFEPQKFGEIKM